jgi:DNA-binding response OmpR family regulator
MKQQILVVDDEDDICTSLQERLTMEGYKVLTASDGRKGLRVYHDHLVDLVITDVLMPELDYSPSPRHGNANYCDVRGWQS